MVSFTSYSTVVATMATTSFLPVVHCCTGEKSLLYNDRIFNVFFSNHSCILCVLVVGHAGHQYLSHRPRNCPCS